MAFQWQKAVFCDLILQRNRLIFFLFFPFHIFDKYLNKAAHPAPLTAAHGTNSTSLRVTAIAAQSQRREVSGDGGNTGKLDTGRGGSHR